MSKIEEINAYYLGFMEVVRQGDGDKCASLCDENVVPAWNSAQALD